MDISVGDRVEMKKQHPCGCKTFEILRVGMDFKIKCEKCGREVMAPRAKIEKNIKKIKIVRFGVHSESNHENDRRDRSWLYDLCLLSGGGQHHFPSHGGFSRR